MAERPDEESVRRKRAVERYLQGERAQDICRDMGRSVRWLRKWMQRRRTGDADWYVAKSRAPHRVHNKTEEAQEQQIVAVREELMSNPQAQIGPMAIQWQFARQGHAVPSRSVIHRVLTAHGLVRRPERYESRGTPYPSVKADKPGVCHQVDVVGPRYLEGGQPFYGLSTIDAVSREAALSIRRRKNDWALATALIESWGRMGRPRYVQLDNMLSLHGSHRYPHSFGLVIRLVLEVGIEPVFIPFSEPWRNGVVERFQDVFDKSFFRTQRFPDYEHLVAAAREFEAFHNEAHCYSALGGKPPAAYLAEHPSQAESFCEAFHMPDELFIRKGKVHLIRFIRSDLKLDIFGEKFTLPDEFQYAYVTATIRVRAQKLHVRQYGGNAEKTYDYAIPKTALAVKKR